MNDAQSPRRSSAATLAIGGLSTVALGLALVGMIRPPRPPVEAHPRASASSPASAGAADARAHGADDRARMRRLERRVAELLEAADPEPAPGPGAEHADTAVDEEHDAEAEMRASKAWWDGLVAAHERESRDAAWAGGAEDLFRAELTAITGDRAFETVALDCRQSSCSATLEWPSYTPGDIQNDTRAVMQHRFQQNCGISLAAPPPDDPAVPYRAEIIFHCAAHRAHLAQR